MRQPKLTHLIISSILFYLLYLLATTYMPSPFRLARFSPQTHLRTPRRPPPRKPYQTALRPPPHLHTPVVNPQYSYSTSTSTSTSTTHTHTPSSDPPVSQDDPLALPEPNTNDANQIDLSTGSGSVKMDHLGPLVVNVDGTLSRITNWEQMAEIEKKNTLRVLGKRNKERLERLKRERGVEEGDKEG